MQSETAAFFIFFYIFIVMKNNIRKIINEVVENYINDDSIKAVLFDFDLTLINTLAFKGINREYIRTTNDISIIKDLIPQTTVYPGIKNLNTFGCVDYFSYICNA